MHARPFYRVFGIVGLLLAAALVASTAWSEEQEPPFVVVAPPVDVAYYAYDLASLTDMDDGERVRLLGFHYNGDGGGGVFVYRADSREPHDGGMVIAPGAPDPETSLRRYLSYSARSARGRWLREIDDASINVRWYGARGDGEYDDGPAIRQTLSYLREAAVRGELYLPAGVYYVPGHFPLHAGVDVRGAGRDSTRIERRHSGDYLVRSEETGPLHATVTSLTFDNAERTLLAENVAHITFRDVGFEGGIVRFTGSRFITIESCVFRENLGKAAYASDDCDNVTLANNLVHNAELGGFNLSGHRHSRVANNTIVRDALGRESEGYAGIRLPNNARFNTVTGNVIENHPRGIFVLSGSTHNTIGHNVIDGAEYQGILIQADHNSVSHNIIANAAWEIIRVDEGSGNIVTHNQLTGDAGARAALSLTGDARDNQITANVIDAPIAVEASTRLRGVNTFADNADVREAAEASE